jgi:hypothetical protein
MSKAQCAFLSFNVLCLDDVSFFYLMCNLIFHNATFNLLIEYPKCADHRKCAHVNNDFELVVPILNVPAKFSCPTGRGKVLGTHRTGLRVKNIVETLRVPKWTVQDLIVVITRWGNAIAAQPRCSE